MSLSCKKLMLFDLVESMEPSLESTEVFEFFRLTNEIRNIDNFIRETPSYPGSTSKIIRDEMLSVIGATLAIEGTLLDKEEIEESLKKAEVGDQLKRREREAENSRKVYSFIMEFVRDNQDNLEYPEALIKQIHKLFTEGLDYVSNQPGKYRGDFHVTFGNPRKTSLCRNQGEVEDAMKNFVAWLNQENKEAMISRDPFVRAIMAHYYLSEIHPFVDGNGRTARAVEALILYAHGVNEYCFWSLANFWSSHRDQYIQHLHQIRETLNPMPFLLWGLNGYREEIESIKNKVLNKIKKLMYLDYIQFLLRTKTEQDIKLTQRIVDVLQLIVAKEHIPLKKFLVTPEVSALYRNVSQSTRSRDLKKMVVHGLIRIEKENDSEYIVPNFRLLERLRYYS